MRVRTTEAFREAFAALPSDVQRLARKSYRLWKANPRHPGLQFKRVHTAEPIYSVRIGLHYRALGLREGGMMLWF